MAKEKKIHLEWAKFYWPQDYEVVDEMKILKEENKKLKKECEENDYLVEDNARWMKECEKKTMEIKKLKSDLAYERTMLDNVRAEYESLQNVIKKMEEELKWWKDLVHKAKEFEYDEDWMDYIYQNTEDIK